MLYLEITEQGSKIEISKIIISVIISAEGEITTVQEACDWRNYLGMRVTDKWKCSRWVGISQEKKKKSIPEIGKEERFVQAIEW